MKPINFMKNNFNRSKRYFLLQLKLNELGLKFTHKSEIYEVIKEDIYRKYPDFIPDKNSVVIDIGAQYGDYSILCEKLYNCNVVSFEPLGKNYKEFIKNIKLNNCKKIRVYNIALSNFIGMKNGIKNNNMLIAKNLHLPFYEAEKITYEDNILFNIGDNILDYYEFNSINIVKIDVEGFEYEVLEGLIETLKKYKPKIIIETHSAELDYKCFSFLTDLGYICKDIIPINVENEVTLNFYEYKY